MLKCPQAFVDLAMRITDASGPKILHHFRSEIAVMDKPDRSPVTIADREAEEIIRDMIRGAYPSHGIVGEEFGNERTDNDWVWVIDPIDGTKSFITGRPWFGTLLALLHHGRPILGVIDHPALGDRWVGASGHGTLHISPQYRSGKPVRCRPCSALELAHMTSCGPERFDGSELELVAPLYRRSKFIVYGGDCLVAGLIASGYMDLLIDGGLDPFDFLALVPVIEEAGGHISDWNGKPLGLHSGHKILVSGDTNLHRTSLEYLNRG